MSNKLQQLDFTAKGREHQQLMLPMDTEILIPENDPVRLASAQLEELDYSKLYRAYSPKGRKSAAEPRIIFKVLVYGYMNGIYSSRKLEAACRKNIDFMWLLEGERVPDHNTLARFRTGRLQGAVEDLFYQYARKLEEMGETDHESVFNLKSIRISCSPSNAIWSIWASSPGGTSQHRRGYSFDLIARYRSRGPLVS